MHCKKISLKFLQSNVIINSLFGIAYSFILFFFKKAVKQKVYLKKKRFNFSEVLKYY